MQSFEDIEKKYDHFSLRGSNGLSGYLNLAGQDTVGRITTSKPLKTDDLSGWCDIWVETDHEQKILLHNTIAFKSFFAPMRRRRQQYKVIPNFVVFNADCLRKVLLVSEIGFYIDRLQYFFHYPVVESHMTHGIEREATALVKGIRKAKAEKSKRKSRDYDFLNPFEIYVVHRIPKAISVSVGDRIFEVWSGMTLSAGVGTIDFRSEPSARIRFRVPTGLDDALDAVWEWKRFFSQVAMERLEPTAISARSKRARRGRSADLYLPNLRGKKAIDRHRFHPGNVPFNFWDDRAALGGLMQRWLAEEPRRRMFRVLLDYVLAERDQRAALEDIVTLCSAVDGLEELSNATDYPPEGLNEMANAAHVAAVQAGFDVGYDRIRTLMGMLQHRGLPAKLSALFDHMGELLSRDDKSLLRSTVMELRQIAAHGRAYSEFTIPKVAPAVEALAAVCVLFDLGSVGAPFEPREHQPLIAVGRLKQSIAELKKLGGR